MGTILVLGIVAAAVVLAIWSMVRAKRNGKSIHCGGDCSRCSGSCHKRKEEQ